jgi:hypothetical protein
MTKFYAQVAAAVNETGSVTCTSLQPQFPGNTLLQIIGALRYAHVLGLIVCEAKRVKLLGETCSVRRVHVYGPLRREPGKTYATVAYHPQQHKPAPVVSAPWRAGRVSSVWDLGAQA